MSSSTISASCSERVLAMSLSSDGAHWLLPPPMITMRGAIGTPPDRVSSAPARRSTSSHNGMPTGCSASSTRCATRPAVRAISTTPRALDGGRPRSTSAAPPAPGAVDRQVLAAALLVHHRDVLEQAQVRTEQPCSSPRSRRGAACAGRRPCAPGDRARAPARRPRARASTALLGDAAQRRVVGRRPARPLACSASKRNCAVSPAGPRNTLPAPSSPAATAPWIASGAPV